MSNFKIQTGSPLAVFKQPKSPKLNFAKVAKSVSLTSKKNKMDQFFGPKTTSMSAMEGRLKVAASKRKIAKVAVKKAKKPVSGMKAKIQML
jgi:hypothetical protein